MLDILLNYAILGIDKTNGVNEMITVTLNGTEIDYSAAVMLMDDGIREYLHDMGLGHNVQGFTNAYARLHKQKFNEDFTVN